MNSNKNIDIKKTTFLEWFLIGSLMTLFLIKIYPVYFAVDDDILTYTIVRHGDLFRWAVHLTKSGRITQFMSTLMLGIPMMADQLWIYKPYCLMYMYCIDLLVISSIKTLQRLS